MPLFLNFRSVISVVIMIRSFFFSCLFGCLWFILVTINLFCELNITDARKCQWLGIRSAFNRSGSFCRNVGNWIGRKKRCCASDIKQGGRCGRLGKQLTDRRRTDLIRLILPGNYLCVICWLFAVVRFVVCFFLERLLGYGLCSL